MLPQAGGFCIDFRIHSLKILRRNQYYLPRCAMFFFQLRSPIACGLRDVLRVAYISEAAMNSSTGFTTRIDASV